MSSGVGDSERSFLVELNQQGQKRSFLMKPFATLLAAGVIALSPTAGLAAPGNSQGPTNGAGWDHLNGPAPGTTGQPFADCEELGTTPGNSANSPGGGSPFAGEGSKAGSRYAGSQPQNSRNNSSVSQYDVACLNQSLNH
jgi:hypothetical protein